MRNYLSLSKVLFICSLGSVSDGKSKKSLWKTILYGLLAICFIPYLCLIYVFFDSAFVLFQQLNQAASLIAVGFYLSNSITFMFALFLIPSIFYFSKDVQTLLSYPLKAETIIAAKFSVTLLYEYAFTLLVLVPMYIAYINHFGFSFSFLIIAILSLITVPILPLIYASLLTMIIMRFVPFAKNRDLFNMVAGLIGLFVGIGSAYYFQNLMLEDPTALLRMIAEGSNSFIAVFSNFFVNIPYMTKAIFESSFYNLFISLAILFIAFMLFLGASKYLYFKGAIGVNEAKSNHKKMKSKALSNSTKSKHIIWAYALKELKLLFRTPVYFLNCISIVVIMPVVLIIPFLLEGGGIDALMPYIAKIDWSSTKSITFLIPCAFAYGLLSSNLNMICASAISREGTNISFMKYIPVPYMQQINAKVLSGFILGELGVLILLIPIAIFIKMPFILMMLCLIISTLTLIFGCYLGILVDLIHPKLVWEQEASAVKQNFTSGAVMMGCMALAFACIGVLFVINDSMFVAYSIFLSILCIAMVPISYILVAKVANVRMPQL
ncbi:MAG: hypothetical protein RSF69_00855 [Erysipelotrichaceae bacterium]